MSSSPPRRTPYRVAVTSRSRLALPAALLVGVALAPTASAVGRAQDRTWHGSQIKVYDAQSAGRYGKGIVVAVIDGWVDISHPDFEGRALAGADCTSGTCVAHETRDGCTHGTHVAGTVGSSSFGVATKATILPVRVLKDDGKGGCTGTPDNVAAGIRWAVAHGARVINLSLGPDVPGLGSSSAIPPAVSDAAAAGVVVIFSAGNADLPVAQSYGNDALVVAATGPSGQLASYSQHGQGVSVAAPGGQPDSSSNCSQAICVTSLYPGGQYAVAAGTSMAAPHVSGLAALLFAQQPGRSRQNVMERITGTAHPLSGAGAGLVDARAALGVTAAAPRPTATSASRPPVVRTQAGTPGPPKRITKPVGPASPRPAATKGAVPSPLAASSPSPSSAPSPAVVPESPRALPTGKTKDKVPVLLAAFAGVLIGLAGTGVAKVSLLRP